MRMAVDIPATRRTAERPKAQQGDRVTEDDIAKAKLGPLGVPGAPDKAPVADADELQIPNALDPGHTA
jgi:hypothetical protein